MGVVLGQTQLMWSVLTAGLCISTGSCVCGVLRTGDGKIAEQDRSRSESKTKSAKESDFSPVFSHMQTHVLGDGCVNAGFFTWVIAHRSPWQQLTTAGQWDCCSQLRWMRAARTQQKSGPCARTTPSMFSILPSLLSLPINSCLQEIQKHTGQQHHIISYRTRQRSFLWCKHRKAERGNGENKHGNRSSWCGEGLDLAQHVGCYGSGIVVLSNWYLRLSLRKLLQPPHWSRN